MNIGERIRTLRERAGLSQAELGQRAGGVRPPAVTQWESGQTMPDPRRLPLIAAALGVGLEELVADIDPGGPVRRGRRAAEAPADASGMPVAADSHFASARRVPAVASMARDLPVRGTTVGGADGEFVLNGDTVDLVRRPPGISPTANVFALYVQGDSMSPRYERGDLVYVNTLKPPTPGSDVVIELHPAKGETAGACYIKRLVKIGSEKLWLAEFFPERREFAIDRRKVRQIWRIYSTAELLGV
ncbi:MAG: helix-turn-helix domain-containing protein [Alphaproteobacteria bacterium]|nr:helix-turn-helix domain-containing protein [Alphaproteobacteria bacterium]